MDKKTGFLFVRLVLITWAFSVALFLTFAGPGKDLQFYTTIIVLMGVISITLAPFMAQINDMAQSAIDRMLNNEDSKQSKES
jgi:hypothetical protein